MATGLTFRIAHPALSVHTVGAQGLFELSHHRSFGIWIGPGSSGGTARPGEVPGPQHPAATPVSQAA